MENMFCSPASLSKAITVLSRQEPPRLSAAWKGQRPLAPREDSTLAGPEMT